MTAESSVRRRVIGRLRPLGAFAVENPVCPGTPDVGLIIGWMELKVATFPRIETSVIAIDIRPEQRIWWRRWRRVGGKCWTFTLVEPIVGDYEHRQPTWFTHDALWSADHLGNVPETVLREAAIQVWSGPMPRGLELARSLR